MFGVPAEGSYLWVNRNLIEMVALAMFIFIPGSLPFGFDRLILRWKEEKARKPVGEMPADSKSGVGRRRGIERSDINSCSRCFRLRFVQEKEMGQLRRKTAGH